MSDFIPNPNLNFEQLWDNSSADLNFGSVDDSTVEPNTVNGTGDVYYDLNGVVASTAYYDPNVFRGLIADVSGDMQDAKLQGIDRQGQFESNDSLKHDASAKWQQSKLIGTDNQAQFEANIKLTSSEQILTESAKRVSTSSNQLAEYQIFIASKTTLSNEDAKLAGQSQ